MSVDIYIAAGKYKNTLPYPTKPNKPRVLDKAYSQLTPAERDTISEVQAQYDRDIAAYKQARREFSENEQKMVEVFRADLEDEYGMKGHPKADLLWNKAWDRGHSSGFGEVALVYDDLVELVK